jgi:hypothetical protein
MRHRLWNGNTMKNQHPHCSLRFEVLCIGVFVLCRTFVPDGKDVKKPTAQYLKSSGTQAPKRALLTPR